MQKFKKYCIYHRNFVSQVLNFPLLLTFSCCCLQSSLSTLSHREKVQFYVNGTRLLKKSRKKCYCVIGYKKKRSVKIIFLDFAATKGYGALIFPKMDRFLASG